MIHIFILAIYRPLAQVHLFPVDSTNKNNSIPDPIVFDLADKKYELVETPNDAIQERPENSNLLSDKDSRARDEYIQNDKTGGGPFIEGQTSYKVFAGQNEPPGISNNQQSNMSEQTETAEQKGTPEPDESLMQLGQNRKKVTKHSKFDKSLLYQQNNRNQNASNSFSDDLNYDQRQSSAEALGSVALNTYAWDFAPYILEMKRKLRENIYPPPAFMQMGVISGETVLRFKVMPDGSVEDLVLVGYEGHKSLAETSMIAVRNSSPFKPLPANFPENYLELTWTFSYTIHR